LAKIYIVHSFTQLSPELWRSLGHPHVMVSADDAAQAMPEALKTLQGLDVLVDSGGYRLISRGKLPDPETVLETQKLLADELGATPVLLDTPVPSPLKATDADFRAANKATAKHARLWTRAFGDHFVYPLHGHTPAQLREALRIANTVAPSVEAHGLGSLVPLARHRPARLLHLAAAARRLLPRRLHVFGVGNSLALALAALGLADSVDTSSPLADARFGVARDPASFSVLVVAGRKQGRRAAPEELARTCSCPVCSREPRLLAAWGRRGVLARTLHNAYHLLAAAADPEKALAIAARNPRIRRAVAELRGRG